MTDLRDHHGMRGLIRHFITSNRGRPGYRRQFGMALLRANAASCPKCRGRRLAGRTAPQHARRLLPEVTMNDLRDQLADFDAADRRPS